MRIICYTVFRQQRKDPAMFHILAVGNNKDTRRLLRTVLETASYVIEMGGGVGHQRRNRLDTTPLSLSIGTVGGVPPAGGMEEPGGEYPGWKDSGAVS